MNVPEWVKELAPPRRGPSKWSLLADAVLVFLLFVCCWWLLGG